MVWKGLQPSGNNIRGQLILNGRDLILELQLPLFQAFDLQLIGVRRRLECDDGAIEIPMFDLELHEKLTQFAFVRSLHPAMLNL